MFRHITIGINKGNTKKVFIKLNPFLQESFTTKLGKENETKHANENLVESLLPVVLYGLHKLEGHIAVRVEQGADADANALSGTEGTAAE